MNLASIESSLARFARSFTIIQFGSFWKLGVGGKDDDDEGLSKEEAEEQERARQEAIKQAERERRDKYKKQEEEREGMRQTIRDKVISTSRMSFLQQHNYIGSLIF